MAGLDGVQLMSDGRAGWGTADEVMSDGRAGWGTADE